jgi:hypothetical protein
MKKWNKMRGTLRNGRTNTIQFLQEKSRTMRNFWRNLPEQIRRLIWVFIILGAVLILVRSYFIPDDFYKFGHYRASAVEEITAQQMKYAGHEVCSECHDDIDATKQTGYHRNLACEVCHGPALDHTTEPEAHIPPAPRDRGYCPLCHEYNPSRPTGFPQIISKSHNPMRPCITCHNPHDPKPPQTPRECMACHAEIARTKSLSHHVNVACTTCHNVPEGHKLHPHDIQAGKPLTRAFCGSCHASDTAGTEDIPKIDLQTHEPRYVCWQCHYPHLPEAE